jgi:hypothetical protein
MRSSFIRALLLLAIPAFASAAEPKDDPKAIVENAIKAIGGEEKLAKVTTHTWKAKGVMTAMGMKLEYVANYTFAAPDRFRFDIDIDAGGMKIKITAATDGKSAWEQMGDMLREMEKVKSTEFHHSTYVMGLSMLFPLKDKAYTLTPLGESKHADQTVVGIKVAREGKRDVSMFFDKKTGLLTKTSSRVIDEFTKKEVTQETVMTGYRDKDGVKVFDKLTIIQDGKEFIVEEMSEQKQLEKVDEKMFAKPARK